MTPEIEGLYERIGEAIVEEVAEPFLTAWTYVEMLEDGASMSLYYETVDRQLLMLPFGKDATSRFFRLFDRLWQLWRQSANEPWSALTFELAGEGGFKIDMSYEDVSDRGAYGDRRGKWKEARFGSRKISVVRR